jgi:hypothetical protein
LCDGGYRDISANCEPARLRNLIIGNGNNSRYRVLSPQHRAEQEVERGYRVCIVDPEGDYAQLAELSRVVAFGHELPLLPPRAVAKLFSSENLSLILTLSSLTPGEQFNYVHELLAALQETRDRTGFPHWVLIDEAHCFFQARSACARFLKSPTGKFCLITYRPSLLAEEVYGDIGAHIVTSTRVEEERYFVTKILQAHDHVVFSAHEVLEALDPSHIGMLLKNAPETSWRVFTPMNRITRHAHHARKYANTRLSDDKAFRFVNAGDVPAAHNIRELYQAVQSLPFSSLRHHLLQGDFSRWVSDVLGDQQLAKGLRKLERSTPVGATPDRSEILAHIKDQYLI